MHDLFNEKWLTFREAARRLGGVHHCTVWRYATKGLKGVRLESFLVGGRRYTTRQALRRFVDRINQVGSEKPMPHKSAKRRTRRLNAAEQELARLGIAVRDASDK